jgi:hypothetical protein
MFLILELLLVTYFRKGMVWKRSKTMLAIVTILLANYCIWFHTMISNANDEYKIHLHWNLSIINSTHCFTSSKFQTELLQKIVSYLLSARMELFILASNLIISLWSLRSCHQTDNSETLDHGLHDGCNYQLLGGMDSNTDCRFTRSGQYSDKAIGFASVICGIVIMLPIFKLILIISFVFRGENDATNVKLEQACKLYNFMCADIDYLLPFTNVHVQLELKMVECYKHQRFLSYPEIIWHDVFLYC